eukprot:TRINITY_DN7076_c0_g1_i2.p1 TRINITY_DN7076_c0_g1~~TRINITY_DN7076_c0_g1_i2.p1  ORF type:complete len:370 (+),score=93.26 TRINITY_DN7076_c0_g1_i2:212-1321(+)
MAQQQHHGHQKHGHHGAHHHHGEQDSEEEEVKPLLVVPVQHLRQLIKGRMWRVQDFNLIRTIGTGTFSRIFLAKLAANGADNSPFALKVMKKAHIIKTKQVEHVKGEKIVMSMLIHPFIISMLTTFQDERRLFMLLEFASGGDLFSRLAADSHLPNDASRFYAGEIVLAFSYLHAMKIAYRDLKPENVLLCGYGHVKLADFGFAKIVTHLTYTLCGTTDYLAPEMIQRKGHTSAVDWWALGVLIYEMLSGAPPFAAKSAFETYEKALAGVLDYPRHFDVKAKGLLSALLVKEPEDRLGHSAEDVKKHRWFKGIDWDQLLNRSIAPPFVPQVEAPDDTSLFEDFPDSDSALGAPIEPHQQKLFEVYTSEV